MPSPVPEAFLDQKTCFESENMDLTTADPQNSGENQAQLQNEEHNACQQAAQKQNQPQPQEQDQNSDQDQDPDQDQDQNQASTSLINNNNLSCKCNDMALRLQILTLTEQLETLEAITQGDSALGISGISNLKNSDSSINNWEDRLHCLLYQATVPFPWYLEIVPSDMDHSTENDIEIAYIYFINEATKNESKKRIYRYLQSEYPNRVTIV